MELVKRFLSNRRVLIIGAALLALAAIVVVFGGGGNPLARAQPTPTLTPTRRVQQVVSAEGTVVPVTRATFAFKAAGRVSELPMREGTLVKAGTVLARLDTRILEAQANQAQAALEIAQSQLARVRAANAANIQIASATVQKLRTGPTELELGVAESRALEVYVAFLRAQDAYDRFGWIGGALEINLRGARDQAGAANTTAQAELARIKAGARSEEIAVAEAQLALVQGPAGQNEVRAAEAQVEQANAALALARANLQDATIVAPFDGVVSLVNVEVGQVVNPGQMVVQIGDASKLQVETTDLSELDVAKVKIGQSVNISVDAFSGTLFRGTVARVAHAANDRSGKKVFKVLIDLPDTTNSGLRWGMTANTEIIVGQ